MQKSTTSDNSGRPAKGNPKPVRFDHNDSLLISQLQQRSDPPLSATEIIRRSVRFAVPKFLSGEAPLTEIKPRARRRRNSPAAPAASAPAPTATGR